jgi:hypothetical protein
VFIKRVKGWNPLPRFYGIYRADIPEHEFVCIPVPFNLLAGWARCFWHWIKRGVPTTKLEAGQLGAAQARREAKSQLVGILKMEPPQEVKDDLNIYLDKLQIPKDDRL